MLHAFAPQLLFSFHRNGVRVAQPSEAFDGAAAASTSALLTALAPQGPGHFHFVSVGGTPMLLGMRLGQLGVEHLAAVFLRRHAPGVCLTIAVCSIALHTHKLYCKLQTSIQQGSGRICHHPLHHALHINRAHLTLRVS
jgi:hypothetical protein